MTQNIDLKDIEKKILKTAHQHGVFDTMIGFIVLGMAFGPFFRESLPPPYNYFLWPLIVVLIAIIFPMIVLKYVIQPRIGIVKPGLSLKSIRKKLFIVTSIQVIIHLIFIIILAIGIGSGIHVEGFMFMLIIGLFFIPIFAIIAYLMKYPRLYLIGMLIWLAIFINELLYDPIDYRIRWLLSYGIIGSGIFITGLVIFIQFLKKHPKLKSEMV
ncbi:MAG: hypothetical protein ACFE96_12655 [Candidatus Hermodarchaeota archaeon]